MNGPLVSTLVLIAAVLAWPGPTLISKRDRALYCLGLATAAGALVALAMVLA